MAGHRMRAVVCLALIALGIVSSSAEGGGKRGRRVRYYPQQTAPQQPVQGTVSYCPIFVFSHMGDECAWYTIPCTDGIRGDPFAWMTDCNAGPTSPCDSCIPQSHKPTLPIASGLLNGFKGELQPPVTVPVNGKAALGGAAGDLEFQNTIHQNVVMKLQVPGPDGKAEEVFAQLISLTTTVKQPAGSTSQVPGQLGEVKSNLGIQIQPQDKVNGEIPASQIKPWASYPRILTVTFDGAEYTVVLKHK